MSNRRIYFCALDILKMAEKAPIDVMPIYSTKWSWAKRRAMRPATLDRKNWLNIGSQEAGPKVAAIASIVETCLRLDLNLQTYLNDVLPRFGD